MSVLGEAERCADPKALVAGNWKMNGWLRTRGACGPADMLKGVRLGCDVHGLPPEHPDRGRSCSLGSGRPIGAQDCHPAAAGAFTGDISAEMLEDAGGRG